MVNQDALKRIDAAVEAFDNCKVARAKLAGKELTLELFDEINGADRGLENLLGRSISLIGAPVESVRALKNEIFDALINAETAAGKEVVAAIECLCADVVEAMQAYDTSSENNAALKAKLLEKLKSLDDVATTTLLGAKIEGVIYQKSQAFQFIELMEKATEFWDSDTCNLGRLTEISKLNAGEMTDDDKEFLKNLSDACDENRDTIFRHIWHIPDDALTDAKLSAAGYTDKESISDLITKLFKAEQKFFKVLRKIRESFAKDTDTADSQCVKNSEFWCTVSRMFNYLYTMISIRRGLWEMFALIDKAVVTPLPNTDDNNANPEENKTDDNNPTPENKDNPNPDDNNAQA